NRGRATRSASPTPTRRPDPSCAPSRHSPGSTTTNARSPPSHRVHAHARTDAYRLPVPTPGTADTPAYTSYNPAHHAHSYRVRVRPRDGTADTCLPRARNRSHHADTSPHTPNTPYTNPTSRPRRTTPSTAR